MYIHTYISLPINHQMSLQLTRPATVLTMLLISRSVEHVPFWGASWCTPEPGQCQWRLVWTSALQGPSDMHDFAQDLPVLCSATLQTSTSAIQQSFTLWQQWGLNIARDFTADIATCFRATAAWGSNLACASWIACILELMVKHLFSDWP